jgi:hypothetical protein
MQAWRTIVLVTMAVRVSLTSARLRQRLAQQWLVLCSPQTAATPSVRDWRGRLSALQVHLRQMLSHRRHRATALLHLLIRMAALLNMTAVTALL